MSSIKDAFVGSKKPQSSNPIDPTNMDQIKQAYGQTQGGIQNAQNYYQQASNQNGFQNQANVYGQQQALANQLQGMANGQGPNPALAQLNQTTAQNAANTAALMGSQRGSSSNPALIARQAAQQGAGLQQQAAGQAATMNAQQQLAAVQALQQQQNMLGNTANTQVGQQYQGLGMYNQAAQNEQANLLGAQANVNNVNAGMQGNINTNNAGMANTAVSGIIGSAAGLGMAAMKAKGGLITAPKHFAVGGNVGGFSDYLNFNTSAQQPMALSPLLMEPGGQGVQTSIPRSIPMDKASNQTQGVHPADQGITTTISSEARGGPISGEMLAALGKRVPGKAKVKGDSYKNDTVPALLSAGEVVIPRHVMQSNDPVNNAARFVQAILAKKHMGKKS